MTGEAMPAALALAFGKPWRREQVQSTLCGWQNIALPALGFAAMLNCLVRTILQTGHTMTAIPLPNRLAIGQLEIVQRTEAHTEPAAIAGVFDHKFSIPAKTVE